MPKKSISRFNASQFQDNILEWYAKNRRVLPWRVAGGGRTDPYKVWMSEIMLQQTTVPAVIPYFLKFLEKWPSVFDLANARDEDVMVAWAGLGYYARARNLLKCARVVAHDFGGVFPKTIDELIKLSGVGPYTAAAISTIAYGNAATVMDGNIERIVARIFAIETPLPQGKKDIREKADIVFADISELGKKSVQAFPQALMDIGAGVCTPKNPLCEFCPVQKYCQAYKLRTPESFPVRAIKKESLVRKGKVYWIQDKAGNVMVEKRSDNRMLGGMLGLPTTNWDKKGKDIDFQVKGLKKIGVIYHTFTHFKLELDIYGAILPDIKIMLDSFPQLTMLNLKESNINKAGFPTVFLKASKMALKYFSG